MINFIDRIGCHQGHLETSVDETKVVINTRRRKTAEIEAGIEISTAHANKDETSVTVCLIAVIDDFAKMVIATPRDRSGSPGASRRHGRDRSDRSPPRNPRSTARGTQSHHAERTRAKSDDFENTPDRDIKMEDSAAEDAVTAEMRRLMKFTSFRSTQNTDFYAAENKYNYGVRKDKQTKYRQYMNRTGGFNRPLSPTR
jgi:hypothetical protein